MRSGFSFVLFITVLALDAIECTEKTTSEQTSSLKYAVGDVRNCGGMQQLDTSKPLLRMNVLPGLGFDNLRNLDMGQVLYFNYSMCQVSGDGLYLLPNDVYLIPIQESKVDIFSQVIDSFQDHKSETALSINLQFKYSGAFSSVSGSFSTDYQDTKSKMVNHNSMSSRVSLRYKLFTAHMQPDAQLHPTFKSRLLDVAAQIQNNNTKLAHYLSEQLVRDYGTHVITSVDAGAGLSQTTFISSSFLKDQENKSLVISASAGASFGSLFKISASVKTSVSSSDLEQFSQHRTNSHISTYGGPMYRAGNFTLSDWEDGVLDNLVAIDRSGVPLYSVVNTNNLPELPDSTLLQLMGYVYNSVTKYYQVNTVSGCMDPGSPKFNFHANVDDKSCEDQQLNYTFGGIYQTCYIIQMGFEEDLCNSSLQTNPLTQDYSCPTGYKAILLHRGVLSDHKVVTTCQKKCSWFSCHKNCWSDNRINSATYSAFWCAHDPGQEVPPDSGMMFGGVYTSKEFNLLTGARTCPSYFYPLHFGLDIWVCVSSDANGVPYSVPFGGFDSCTNGNALAATSQQFSQGIFPHRCSKHYSQFLVTIDEGCLINFCADMRSIMQKFPHPPKLPPYHPLPRMSVNVTNTLVIKGAYGAVWIKNQADGTWQQYTSGQQTSEEYLREIAEEAAGPTNPPTNSPNADGITSGGMAGMMAGLVIGSVVGTVMIGALVALVVFGIRKAAYKKKRRPRNESAYLTINEEIDASTQVINDSVQGQYMAAGSENL